MIDIIFNESIEQFMSAAEVVAYHPESVILGLASIWAAIYPIRYTAKGHRAQKIKHEKHVQNIRKSHRILNRLEAMVDKGNYQEAFAFLRFHVDPYTFEECVLSAFERSGAIVERSNRYSGDGGVDGVIKYRGRRWLIQSKRYRGHIALNHVKKHQDLCRKAGAGGVFVHVGKTGAGAWREAAAKDVLILLSGRKLIDFLGGHLPIESILAT